MSVVDRERFLKGLSKSGVLDESALEQWKGMISPDAGSKDLAKDLVAKKMLTSWQAKMLLKGASKLTMGNFLLTDRVTKSDFGDCFAAIHPQLSRNVSIQCLPAALSSSSESKKKVFSLGSKLSELDHPNLLHIYDVDEEGDRVYLVSEVGNALPLPDYLSDNPPLGCAAIAKLIAGSLRGISYAHSNGVIHSEITEKSIFVKPKGDAKIGGLTRFAVSNAFADKPAVAESDLVAIKQVAKTLLKAVPVGQQSGDDFASLKKAIVLIDDDLEASMSMFDELAESFVVASDILDSDVGIVAELEPVSPVGLPAGVPSQGFAKPTPRQAKPATVSSKDGFLTSMAKQNPVALISASVLASVLLIGGTFFAATNLLAQPATASAEVADAFEGDSEIANVTSVALSGSAPAATREAMIDPDANRKKIEALFGKSDPSEKESDSERETAAADRKVASRKAAIDPEANRKKIEEMLAESSAAPASKESDVEPAETVADDTEQPAEPETAEVSVAVAAAPKVKARTPQKPAAKTKTKELKEGENPFTKFPASVDLPDVENTKQVTFGKLVLEKRHLLGAEILSTPNVHRSKPVFTMVRSEDDRQTWDIGHAVKKNKTPVVIAKLQKTPTELKFNWLPGAADIKTVNALRNCRIKLATPNDSKWLTLRKPVKIKGFMFEKNSGRVKVEVDLPHLPNAAAISGVLYKMPFERHTSGKDGRRERASLHPASFSSNQKARMHLHDDADQFITIDVNANIRKALTLQAALVVLPSEQLRGFVLDDPSALQQRVTGPIRQIHQRTKLQADQAKKQEDKARKKASDKKYKGKKKSEFLKPFVDSAKAYDKVAKAAAGKAELTEYYEHVVPQFYGKDIPIVLTYALNSEHRIILAYTVSDGELNKK